MVFSKVIKSVIVSDVQMLKKHILISDIVSLLGSSLVTFVRLLFPPVEDLFYE